jgi:predicted RNase H-like HicB family nuclease
VSEYVVLYEQAEDGGWGAYLPDVPGVIALGKTREEVGERILEALNAHVDYLRDEGRPLPPPVHVAGTVQV